MLSKYTKLLTLSLNLLFLLQSIQITNAKVLAIIVFGDSTVDPGNNNNKTTIVKSNFAPYGRDFDNHKPTGRFSNGRLATDFISEAFGLPRTICAFLDCECTMTNFSFGVSFASAGSGFDNETANSQYVMPLSQQLEYYKKYQETLKNIQGEIEAQKTLSEALYFISLGTNDFTHYFNPVQSDRSQKYNISQYEDIIIGLAEDFIRKIYELGARKLAFSGLGPFGCCPLERTTDLVPPIIRECKKNYNDVAIEFNGKLQKLVVRLNSDSKLSGMKIVICDGYDLSYKIIENPVSYEFDVSDSGCCGTGKMEVAFLCNNVTSLTTCKDASKYVFWDAVHPTERMYRKLVDHYMNATFDTPMSIFKPKNGSGSSKMAAANDVHPTV